MLYLFKTLFTVIQFHVESLGTPSGLVVYLCYFLHSIFMLETSKLWRNAGDNTINKQVLIWSRLRWVWAMWMLFHSLEVRLESWSCGKNQCDPSMSWILKRKKSTVSPAKHHHTSSSTLQWETTGRKHALTFSTTVGGTRSLWTHQTRPELSTGRIPFPYVCWPKHSCFPVDLSQWRFLCSCSTIKAWFRRSLNSWCWDDSAAWALSSICVALIWTAGLWCFLRLEALMNIPSAAAGPLFLSTTATFIIAKPGWNEES